LRRPLAVVVDGAVGTKVGSVNGAPVVMVGKSVGSVGNKVGSVGRPVVVEASLDVAAWKIVEDEPSVVLLEPVVVEPPSVVVELPSVVVLVVTLESVVLDDGVTSRGLMGPALAGGNGFPSSSQPSPISLSKIEFIGGD